jgi:GTP-binding protein EngB required for normal cell division
MAGGFEHIDPESEPSTPALDIRATLVRAGAQRDHTTQRETQVARLLREFAARLEMQRLQVAVVGQFKRGKSSLLNALLGANALPTGVLPLTAAPTFIEKSEDFALTISRVGEVPRRRMFASANDLREALNEFVAESSNPKNVKRVLRVDVGLTSPLLLNGLVLIDTPGVGSTWRHNTDAAETALPECDAALMVFSPDPPITELELAYLKKIQSSAAEIVIVLNKIDTLDGVDLQAITGFLVEVLASAGFANPDVLAVSARTGSGMAALRDRLTRIAKDRDRLLTAAIRQKAGPLIGDLIFENDLALSALTTPLAMLDERLARFQRATLEFASERRSAIDHLAGDRQRLLAMLDADADALRDAIRPRVVSAFEKTDSLSSTPQRAWETVKAGIPVIFDQEMKQLHASQAKRLAEVLGRLQDRADELLADIRRTAADVLDIPYRIGAPAPEFDLENEPGWVSRPRETLGAAPAELLERIVPGPLGRARARKRILDEIDQIVRVNVEQLRWSTRQNIEESLRRFGTALDKALAGGVDEIAQSVHAIRALREGGEAEIQTQLSFRRPRADELRRLSDALPSGSGCLAEYG